MESVSLYIQNVEMLVNKGSEIDFFDEVTIKLLYLSYSIIQMNYHFFVS